MDTTTQVKLKRTQSKLKGHNVSSISLTCSYAESNPSFILVPPSMARTVHNNITRCIREPRHNNMIPTTRALGTIYKRVHPSLFIVGSDIRYIERVLIIFILDWCAHHSYHLNNITKSNTPSIFIYTRCLFQHYCELTFVVIAFWRRFAMAILCLCERYPRIASHMFIFELPYRIMVTRRATNVQEYGNKAGKKQYEE